MELIFNFKILIKITVIQFNVDIVTVTFQHFDETQDESKNICGNLKFQNWLCRNDLQFDSKISGKIIMFLLN